MQRRTLLLSPLLVAGCGRRQQDESGWPASLDEALIRRAVAARDQRFDPDYNMLRVLLGPEYRYHTRLRECQAHPTRESLEYALYLLEEGSPERTVRALRILERVLPLQVADPQSRWYGLWGWYLEEPPDRMAPADFNWADFNGALLLLIEIRHGSALPEALRQRVRAAIGHAARSVMRRDVSMSYTNIAILGTFVTLAAGERLGDAELTSYARQRIVRLAREIDRTGSFAEYNSPAYARVSLVNLARIRMYVHDAEARGRAARIERRLWEHLAAHWDAARLQFCGPMSRCYSTDLGYPLWLEKALRGRLRLATPDNRTGDDDGETAIHDLRCPEDLAVRFLAPQPPHEHREWYLAGPDTAGTAWFSRDFSLGSVNRGDFWVQRRPLLGYFGDASRPARTVQLRVVKDGYDFASALLHSVQQQGRVLALISFRDPGGDRHVSLDPIRNSRFECGRLFAELHVSGLPEGYSHEIQGSSLRLDSAKLRLAFHLIGGRFGARQLRLDVHPHSGDLTATIDFKPPAAPRLVAWPEVRTAFAAVALELADAGAPLAMERPSLRLRGEVAELEWGPLWLRGLVRAAPVEEHERAFAARIAGQPAPLVRLSEERLA
ncbi:MAG: hypothetical protein KatS3mg004_2328 [Bryobacteraceae bacterium]|nr:MAG: hypothetical protein KatS3mg004_2328 [Bryobacteraceae bacterium]